MKLTLHEIIEKMKIGKFVVANMGYFELLWLLRKEREEELREYEKRIDSFES